MQVKLILEIDVDIPGEFQDDMLATKLLQDEVDERFDIGCEYEKYDQPSVMFRTAKIIQYIPGKGKL
jgi:hypothetical protein